MEGYDYDAAVRIVKIEDIATDEINQEILRKLKENDPEFDKLCVGNTRGSGSERKNIYCPKGTQDLGWLGYFIGKNTILMEVYLRSNPCQDISIDVEPFFRGVDCNTSVRKIAFNVDLLGGEIFQSLRPFSHNNNNLSELEVERCEFGFGCARQLALALRGCNKSLKSISVSRNQR